MRRWKRYYPLPSTVKRETIIDPVALVDIPKDFAIGHKRPVWA
jgi:hypothetical protein